ncbi:MAG TPA: MFS transporter, partial [Thermomicrobiales bacterium]|nr:MFS transporter [Thermomicrobiales bacterium]
RSPFLPFYIEDLGASSLESQALWAGIINAGGALMMAVSAPIWGIVADRYGRKPMVLRAMFAGSVTIGLMSLATSPWHLLILRFIEGGVTGTVTASMTLVASTTPKERMGFGLGMMQMAVFSGGSVGPLAGGILADQIGYRATFVVAGSMLFLGGLIVLTQVREQFTRTARGGTIDEDPAYRLRALLMGSSMLAMIAVMFTLRVASGAVQPIMPLYVETLAGSASGVATLSGLTLGVAGLTSALASITLGRLADRIGQRPVLIVASFAVGLLYLPQAFAQSALQLIVLQGLFGIAAGGILPSANAIVAHLTPPARRGAVYGFTAAATSVGGSLGALGGSGMTAAVDIRYVFIVSGLLMLGAAGWVMHAVRDVDEQPSAAPT